MNAASSAVLGYSVILAPSPRKPCHSSPSSSSHGGAYSVRPVRSLTVSVIGTIGACGLVMVQNLPGGAVGPGPAATRPGAQTPIGCHTVLVSTNALSRESPGAAAQSLDRGT